MYKHLFIVLLLFCSLNGFSQNKDHILGKWLNTTGEAHIQIYQSGNKFFGKLIWLKEPLDADGKPKRDRENPNNALSNRPILGLIFLKDFLYKDGIWQGGTIYDPKTGKTYSCKISAEGKDKINVRGFVGFSLLGRTETWTRVE
jgi:uncharacterized protein (DUF2147 family)